MDNNSDIDLYSELSGDFEYKDTNEQNFCNSNSNVQSNINSIQNTNSMIENCNVSSNNSINTRNSKNSRNSINSKNSIYLIKSNSLKSESTFFELSQDQNKNKKFEKNNSTLNLIKISNSDMGSLYSNFSNKKSNHEDIMSVNSSVITPLILPSIQSIGNL